MDPAALKSDWKSQSLVFIPLLLLLPNLQFHSPPSPVSPMSTNGSNFRLYTPRCPTSGFSGREALSYQDCLFHETYEWELIHAAIDILTVVCVLQRNDFPFSGVIPSWGPCQHCEWPAIQQINCSRPLPCMTLPSPAERRQRENEFLKHCHGCFSQVICKYHFLTVAAAERMVFCFTWLISFCL